MSELKPCPFCGGKVTTTNGTIGTPFYFFKCFNCGAIVSFNNKIANREPKKAIDYWNSRAREDK